MPVVNFFERRKILKNSNYLDLTPYKIYQAEIDENGIVTVLVPKFTNKIAEKTIMPFLKHKYFKIKLDEIGSEVWKSIDSKKNVEDISKKMLEHFGEKIQPVYERVTKFLSSLYLQGYISFIELNKKGD